MSAAARILVVTTPISRETLAGFIGNPFPDMVKFVADVERGILAIGGELHADAEAILLDQGSRQQSLWGGNYFPGRGESGCLEYGSLINIRPAQQNESMHVQDAAIREQIRKLVTSFVGRGEPLT